AINDLSISAATIENVNPVTYGSFATTSTLATGIEIFSNRLNLGFDAERAGDRYQSNWNRFDTYVETEAYATAAPMSFYPTISASNVNISNFDRVDNNSSIISAENRLTISGNSGAIFNNISGDLEQRTYSDQYTIARSQICALGGGSCQAWDTEAIAFTGRTLTSATIIYDAPSGIFAGELDAVGFSLVNKGSRYGTNSENSGSQNVSVSRVGVLEVSDREESSLRSNFDEINQLDLPNLSAFLPTNPNGYFIYSLSPSSQYLVETNPLYAVGNASISTTYFEERYGYSPETLLRRLGDANYESYLVEKQLTELTGSNILYNGVSRSNQMRQLIVQGATEAESLGFEYGKEPTKQQLDSLVEDIVWVVAIEVNGETVLAPKVYLSPRTKTLVSSGATISANNINIFNHFSN
ncbi:MAG: hypothetical protein ACPGEF_07285, partial [Endozoicomonas sp.]